MTPETKKPRLKLTTPAGVFAFPKLNNPDTKFNADGVYEVNIRYTEDEVKEFREKLEQICTEAVIELGKEHGKKTLKAASFPIKAEVDKNGNETGNWLLKAKLKAKMTMKDGTVYTKRPILYDSQCNILTKQIWGGTVGKASVEVIPFYTALAGAGISLRLKAVQVLKLVSEGAGGKAESFGFDKEADGYVEMPENADAVTEVDKKAITAEAKAGDF
jgi:hypothetical protein